MRFVIGALLSLIACSHAQPAPATPPAASVQASAEPAPAPQHVATPVPPQLSLVSVHFEFDRSELLPDARVILDTFFETAQKLSDQRIRIEGNCDERGSEEYNIALGQRRADAAKKYLVGLGLPADRIATISYGEERPLSLGHDDEAWKENRRVDLVPLTGDASNAVTSDSR